MLPHPTPSGGDVRDRLVTPATYPVILPSIPFPSRLWSACAGWRAAAASPGPTLRQMAARAQLCHCARESGLLGVELLGDRLGVLGGSLGDCVDVGEHAFEGLFDLAPYVRLDSLRQACAEIV